MTGEQATTVCVAAPPRRPVSPDMFADITPAAPTFGGGPGEFTVTFDAELDQDQAEAVRNRLLTKDEPQAAARQVLLDHLAALCDDGVDPDLRVVLADTLAYLLGE
jgi:hypothetical protein